MFFRFTLFSERLGHGKYDFQHLQDTARVQKSAQFREFSEDQSVWTNNVGNFLSHPAIFNGLLCGCIIENVVFGTCKLFVGSLRSPIMSSNGAL